MGVIDDLLACLPTNPVALREVRIGAFWTVVWSERGAGLASTQRDTQSPHGHSLVSKAGKLLDHTAQEMAGLLQAKSPMEAALGMAAVNSLLDIDDARLVERNAAEEIIQRGNGKRVAIVGHFPFIPKVQHSVAHLDVLELWPGSGELPTSAAADVLPQADVVAITGTSLVNRTFDHLISHCSPDAFVLVLGPTSPLSQVLFDYGVDLIAGTRVIDPTLALLVASQGAIFRQMRGVQLVTMARDG